MNKAILLTIASLAVGLGANAYDYTDDIYYNPKQEKTNSSKSTTKKGGQYMVDFSTMDVDEYNKRGQYYYTPIDTIGAYIENEPDFVYTTQIQKYYNPTIVTDNADLIADVLNNSYGNVEIIYNYNGAPSIVPWTYYNWPAYSYSWYNPWSWSFNFGPFGWNIGWNNWWSWNSGWGWNWGPSWSWGPSWGWGPSWNWAWGGPGWGWGGGWRPGWGTPPPPRPMATYSPGGRAPFGGPHGGMAHNTNVGNYNGNGQRPGSNAGNMAGNQPPRRPQTPTIQHGNNVSANQNRPTFTTNGQRPLAGNGNDNPSFNGGGNINPGVSRPSIGTQPSTITTNKPLQTTTNPSRPSTNTTTRPSTTTTTRPSTPSTTTRPATPSTTTRPSNTTTTTRPSTTTTTRPTTTTRQTTTNSRPSQSSGSFNSGGRSGGGFSGGGSRSGGGHSGGGGRGGRR